MVQAANKNECSSINRIAITERTSLEDFDRLSPYFLIKRTTMTSETSEEALFVRF